VYLLKRCPQHGEQRVLIADDAAYWRLDVTKVPQAAKKQWCVRTPRTNMAAPTIAASVLNTNSTAA